MSSTAALTFNKYDLLSKKIVLSSIFLCQNFATFKAIDPKLKTSSQVTWNQPLGYETNISIYNPLVKKKTKLVLQNENCVKWYSCGPTVYDSAHIGHASSYIRLDIIRRILSNVFGLNVFYLMGITDIDDKIIARSNETKEDFRTLAKRYEVEFFQDLSNLNVLPPTMTVRVSDHIPEIISFVKGIMQTDRAYKAKSGSVYFSTQKFPRYGKLRSLVEGEDEEGMKSGEKEHPHDFSLWKAAKPQEPHWDSPWGPGRPGWHIECSAMASKVLGPSLDIHSGGQDLVFPHHENEEAQSCVYHDTSQWVNYWLHTGHLQVKGDVKMSKSLKNTISISEFLKSYTSNHLRMLCLLSPYRHGIDYSTEAMKTAENCCHRIQSFVDECQLYLAGLKGSTDIDEPFVLKQVQETKKLVENYLADDFDTPRAMTEILKFVTSVNSMIGKPVIDAASSNVNARPVAIASAMNFVKDIFATLGITFASDKGGAADHQKLSSVLDATMDFRSQVREVALHPDMAAAAKPQRQQLLQSCDQFRDDLAAAGVEIKDHRSQKSTWSLKDIAVTQE
ncbi:probable cysteine--tRNA ligase, mitochondrial [Macrosteles quadrilineatus]|uniref:probable cysteine--tRNA ligase, mitochondrial n=1 Tax=Macrosteles quadrilineatus TaxID=74068 RepID=UPI0023E18CC6|nr:probable cysteine--tRNA ligase, mitochondrial [Macrosteles quadrilineatus]